MMGPYDGHTLIFPLVTGLRTTTDNQHPGPVQNTFASVAIWDGARS